MEDQKKMNYSKTFTQIKEGCNVCEQNHYLLSQIIRLNQEMNIQLEKNRKIIQNIYLSNNQVKIEHQGVKETNSSESEQEKVEAKYQLISRQKTKAIRKRKKILKEVDSSDIDYQPSNEPTDFKKKYKPCETKNIPKNFGKSIIKFVKNNEEVVEKILIYLDVNKEQFYQMIEEKKEKINTIAQLRSLWIEEKNKFAQIMRIISIYYLRRYSLSHIFNSKVQYYNTNIKYRQKLLEAVKNPWNFTHMKDF